MVRKLLALGLAVAGLAVSACGGRGGSPAAGSGVDIVTLPQVDPNVVIFATVPRVGEELPSEGLGTIKSGKWKALLGGFTQQRYSQSLGFKPGTKITILNLSDSITHTLDVVKEIKGPPAVFPKNPNLPVQKHGGSNLETGYASGPIKPHKSVTVTLAKAGIYLIGCAYHYRDGMHDVLVVAPNGAPGPQATPPRGTPSSSPTIRSSYAP